eukprot:COSAG06_NODE_22859_length_710_cov_1.166939_2_plen_139_part_00
MWSRSVTHEAVVAAGQVRRHLLIIFHPNTLQSPTTRSLSFCAPILQLRGWPVVLGDHTLPLSLSLTPCTPRMHATPQTAPRVRGGDPISKSFVMAETGRLPIQAYTTMLTLYLVRAAPPLLLLSQPQSPHQHPRGRQQ